MHESLAYQFNPERAQVGTGSIPHGSDYIKHSIDREASKELLHSCRLLLGQVGTPESKHSPLVVA